MNRERIVWATLLLWGLAACGDASDAVDHSTVDAAVADPLDASSSAPFPSPDWQMSTPEQQGMRKEGIDVALDYAFQSAKNTQGVLVIRHRSIVAERYESGRDQSSFAASWSMGKSITSALVGIAIDRGLIKDVDVKLTDYYPDWAGTPKADMRLRDVLQMASGLAWVEEYRPGADMASDIVTMVFEADALKFASTRQLKNAPGSVFNYSSGDTMLVSGVLEKATGKSTLEFGKQELFSKIGMAPLEWWRDTSGHTLTYCCVDTPTRQFAKFGLLFLERGKWNGERILSEAWIEASLRPSPSFEGYGYFWWLIGRTNPAIPSDTFAARGVDGQLIYVIPGRDLIVVRNGHYDKRAGEPVADPNLFTVYPSFGIVPDAGTRPPDSWKDEEFLAPIVSAIMD